MSLHQENMANVEDWGELLPEKQWFHGRISKVVEKPSENSGEPVAQITIKVQDEPFTGRAVTDFASLQPQALAKLKKYYTVTGKGIVENGHDPELLVDGELYFRGTHELYKGEKRFKISPFDLRSIMEGR